MADRFVVCAKSGINADGVAIFDCHVLLEFAGNADEQVLLAVNVVLTPKEA